MQILLLFHFIFYSFFVVFFCAFFCFFYEILSLNKLTSCVNSGNQANELQQWQRKQIHIYLCMNINIYVYYVMYIQKYIAE